MMSPSPSPSLCVLASPRCEGEANPYTHLLYDALEQGGTSVDEFSVKRVLERKYDILHVHWPDARFNRRYWLNALLRSLVFLAALWVARVRGARIVWTIHNLQSHERRHPVLECYMRKVFFRLVNGTISLGHLAHTAALTRHEALRSKPSAVIPHGHYRPAYPNEVTGEAARAFLGLEHDAIVITYLGAIRPYKGVPALVTSFRELDNPTSNLVIAGLARSLRLRDTIETAAAGDERIKLFLRAFNAEEVQVFLNAATVVVLPFTTVLNSGSVMLALSFGKPVLVPDVPSIRELQRIVGSRWIHTYSGDLTSAILENACQWARDVPRDARPDLSHFDWQPIAERTLAFFQELASPASLDGSLVGRTARPLTQESISVDRLAL